MLPADDDLDADELLALRKQVKARIDWDLARLRQLRGSSRMSRRAKQSQHVTSIEDVEQDLEHLEIELERIDADLWDRGVKRPDSE